VVDFKKRSAIKSQIMADFVADWMEPNSRNDGIIPESPWLVSYDESWGSARARVVVVLMSPSKLKLQYATRLQFTNEVDNCTNNIAEYEAILLGLHKLRAIVV
jgi:hypothetical protein